MSYTTTEKASIWFKENESHIKPSQTILHHFLKYYSGKSVSWRRDSPVKVVLGTNMKEGRISITPQTSPNIRVRFAPLEPAEQIVQFVEELKSSYGSVLTFNLDDKILDVTSDFQDASLKQLTCVTDLILDKFNFIDFTKPNSYDSPSNTDEEALRIQEKASSFKNIMLNEAAMERRFVNWLKKEHDIDAKSQDRDGLFRRDVTYNHNGFDIIAELKYTSSVRENIEQAIGQLLRYKLHPLAKKDADKLLIVSGGNVPTNDDIVWFSKLKAVIDLKIEILCEDPTTIGVFKCPNELIK